MAQSETDETNTNTYSAASSYASRHTPTELSEDDAADLARMKKIALWLGGIALVGALALGLRPILNGSIEVRDSDWRITREVSTSDDSVRGELSSFAGMPRRITIDEWTYSLRAGKLEALANSGELEGTIVKIEVGTTPVALAEIDGWVIVGNNGGSIGGQISGRQKRSISFVDPDSHVVAETIKIGDEPLYVAEFLTLLEVDGDLWVVSKVDQQVWIIEPE